MNIFEASELVSEAQKPDLQDAPSRSRRVPTGNPVERSEAKAVDLVPILPFLPVLFGGRDGGWRNGDALPRHPSVGHARGIYVAIMLNWIIDLVGLTYLFHTYLVSHHSLWILLGVPVFMATALASGLAVFAASLVQKPLRKPQLPPLNKRVVGIAGAVNLVCVSLLLMPGAFGDVGPWLDYFVRLAGVTLGVSLTILLGFAFGPMDAMYVAARGVAMILVGDLVSGPLHQAMFEKEIYDHHLERRHGEIETEVSELEASIVTRSNDREKREEALTNTKLEVLEPAGKGPSVAEPAMDCSDEEKRYQLAVAVSAAWAMASDSGGRAGKLRQQHLNSLRAGGFPVEEVVKIFALGRKSQPRREIITKNAADITGANVAEATAKTARDECLSAAKDQEKVRQANANNAQVDRGNARTEDNVRRRADIDEIIRLIETDRTEIVRLRESAAQLTREVDLGAIDRELELEHLMRESEEVAWVVRGKTFAAWILALLMPFIVVVMKVTAGARLEPYLARRWKEAE